MIYIIIPVFNRIEHTIKCIHSLSKQSYTDYKIVLVDDGSTDKTADVISHKYPDVFIIKGKGDWWWSESMNQGLNYVLDVGNDDDLVLSLNNDLVVGHDYLESLLLTYQNHPKSLIGSVSIKDQATMEMDFAGIVWNCRTAKYKPVKNVNADYSDLVGEVSVLESDLLPGRGTLYPLMLISEIGLYDAMSFPQYVADEDFSLRACKKGYSLLVSTKSVVFSDVSQTGINFKYERPTMRKFILSLFSIRSSTNLKVRFLFSKKHADNHPIYFIFDFGRIFLSFMKKYLNLADLK